MKVTVLVDNIASEGCDCEWGLAFYIEDKDKKVLLDTGASEMFIANAKNLGIDLTEVDYAALSHAHYDHGNGIGAFLDINKKAKFYVRKECDINCYNASGKYIGLPETVLDDYADRIVRVDDDLSLYEGCMLINHKGKELSKVGKLTGMKLLVDGEMKDDDFAHEQSLVFDTNDGLIIFNSCSHGGAMEILNDVRSVYPDKNIRAIIGGLHLFERSDEDVIAIAKDLKKENIIVITGHCTGQRAFDLMEEILQDQILQFYSGLTMMFE